MEIEVIDPHNAQEIFFDGVHDVKILDGVVRTALVSRQNAVGVIVARLALPVAGLLEMVHALMGAIPPQPPGAKPVKTRRKRGSG